MIIARLKRHKQSTNKGRQLRELQERPINFPSLSRLESFENIGGGGGGGVPHALLL